jgi:hypothetical protein
MPVITSNWIVPSLSEELHFIHYRFKNRQRGKSTVAEDLNLAPGGSGFKFHPYTIQTIITTIESMYYL